MPSYRLAGQGFYFPWPIPELESFDINTEAAGEAGSVVPRLLPETKSLQLISRTQGWVGGAQRSVEVYNTRGGFILKIAGCGCFYISRNGKTISKQNPQDELSQLDREIIIGPALVLALALRGIWSLHASAAMFGENVIVFLGESGQGKSTLGAYLSQSAGWRLVADDILPAKTDGTGVKVLPHFPQLKLPAQSQPGVGLPEQLPLKHICILTHAKPDQMPMLERLTISQGVRSLLGHIAGTRMFDAALLAKHLEFSAQVGKLIPAYRLTYPHRRSTLPLVQELFEKIC